MMPRGLAIVAIALGLAACAAEERPREGDPWAEATRRAHAEADRAVAAEDWGGARAALAAALEAAPPAGVPDDARRAVQKDLAWRLAEVELAAERPAEALRRAEQGLGLGRGEDVFTANLLISRGRAREALGQEREAAEDYWQALQINEALLRRTLGEDD